MAKTKNTLHGLGLVALLVGACGDDDTGATGGGATDSATGGPQTESNGDSGVSMTSTASQGDASASGSTTQDTDDDDGSTGTSNGSDDSTTTDGDTTTGTDTTASASQGSASAEGPETGNELCEAPGNVLPCDADSNDPFHAMGLNCPYGENEAIPIFNQSFTSIDPSAWRVASQLGSYIDPVTNLPLWRATEGEKFLIISSSQLNQPSASGILTHQYELSTPNGNPDFQQLPAPMTAARGSNNGVGGTPFVNCDFIGDCSDSLQQQWTAGNGAANDLLWFQFETQVPGGTHGFTFDFAYFSVEFTNYIGTTFNDMFVVWSNSETYTGNLCFINDQPCTVTALGVDPWNPQQLYTESSIELIDTGFYGWNGGGTGWFEAKGSAAPGESLQLTWAIFDMGDTVLDTAVIIDNFQWDCEGCTPSEVNPCGIRPIPT